VWVYTNKGMISIVEHNEDPEILLVRSRERGTLEKLFPEYDVLTLEYSDYPHRVFVGRDVLASMIAKLVRGVDYPNFKSSVSDRNRHDCYMNVWRVTLGLEPDLYQVEVEE